MRVKNSELEYDSSLDNNKQNSGKSKPRNLSYIKSIDINKKTNKNNENISLNNNSTSLLDIKVSNSVLKKDITGKPFLDYICDVKNGKESYTLNKKFGHFIMMHMALKGIFKDKDSIKLPDGGNLFININGMKQNAFHENKISQLDKYISDLI